MSLIEKLDGEDTEQATERVRASKRLSAYREMADQQIESVLATMMTKAISMK